MNNSNNNQNNSSVSDQVDVVMSSPGGLFGASHDDDDSSLSPVSPYKESADLMTVATGNEVTAQLTAAGSVPVEVAAAVEIVSAKKRKRLHSLETNPSKRNRLKKRLLRKLRTTIDELATIAGQQAIALIAIPGKPNTSCKVFGAKPLEDVIQNLQPVIMEELEHALARQAPPPVKDDPTLFELPPLSFDGILTSVEKVTQAQLRTFIPLMLKYSTGRGKPGWGREFTCPPWWPKGLPWANVRRDVRSEDEKQKISWTQALRQIIINCYKYHGREDLLTAATKEDKKANASATANANGSAVGVLKMHSPGAVSTHQTELQANGSSEKAASPDVITDYLAHICPDPAGCNLDVTTQYTPTVLHPITNPDSTVSIMEVCSNNPIITLPDGTIAHIEGMATIKSAQEEDGIPVLSIQTITEGGAQEDVVDLKPITEAAVNCEGQIILTGENVNDVITVPVSASVYETMVANKQYLHMKSDGTVCVMPVPKVEPNNGDNMETSVTPGGLATDSMKIQSSGTDLQQVIQVLLLKDATK